MKQKRFQRKPTTMMNYAKTLEEIKAVAERQGTLHNGNPV